MTARKLAATAVATLAVAALAGPAAAQAASFEGVVTAKNGAANTFTIRQDEGAGSVKIKVVRTTKFQRIGSFGAIKVGATDVEATARRSNGRWIATVVERSGKNGGGGGNDDGPNHQ